MNYIIERETCKDSSDELIHWKYIDKKSCQVESIGIFMINQNAL